MLFNNVLSNNQVLILKVIVLVILVNAISAGNNVIKKLLMNELGYPVSVTIFQYISIYIYNKPLIWMYDKKVELTWRYYLTSMVPLALGRFAVAATTMFSLAKSSVSFTHTIRGLGPLFTVLSTRLFMGETHSISIYLSLIPIIGGVILASATELQFDWAALISGLISTVAFTWNSILSKQILKETGMHHLVLMQKLCDIILIFSVPLWFCVDFPSMLEQENLVKNADTLAFLLFAIGLFFWCQNAMSFGLIAEVSPLTFSILGLTKRMSIVIVSIIVIGNPITLLNATGMIIACAGIFWYNMIKYYERKNKSVPKPPESSTPIESDKRVEPDEPNKMKASVTIEVPPAECINRI